MGSMKTKVHRNTSRSPSLRSTIPQGIVEFLDLKPGDTINWGFITVNNKHVIVVEKVNVSP